MTEQHSCYLKEFCCNTDAYGYSCDAILSDYINSWNIKWFAETEEEANKEINDFKFNIYRYLKNSVRGNK